MEASENESAQRGAGSLLDRLPGRGRSGSGRGGEGPADTFPDAGASADGRTDPGRLIRAAGRVALWALIGLLLVRGVGDVISGGREGATAPAPPTAAAFPDEKARTFAAAFARVYMESTGAAALGPYLAPRVADELQAGQRRRSAQVAETRPAGEQPLGADRALFTVACQLVGGGVLYLAVPVARDAAGGLAVYGLPSFVAPPALASVEPEPAEPASRSRLTRHPVRA
jgi:hypothetical protein